MSDVGELRVGDGVDDPLNVADLPRHEGDPVFLEAAQGLAMRSMTEASGNFTDRLQYTFETCLSRKPSQQEKERLSKYFDQQLGILKKDPKAVTALFPVAPDGTNPAEAAAWVGVSRVLLNLDEFITRE